MERDVFSITCEGAKARISQTGGPDGKRGRFAEREFSDKWGVFYELAGESARGKAVSTRLNPEVCEDRGRVAKSLMGKHFRFLRKDLLLLSD